jgi:hypothetical protein
MEFEGKTQDFFTREILGRLLHRRYLTLSLKETKNAF